MVQRGLVIYDRARFVQHNLWVTRYDPDEKYAAGDYPYQSPDATGPAGVRGGRRPARGHRRGALVHGRRAPHRPARGLAGDAGAPTSASTLKPVGFFDGNPALDMPPSATCHPVSDADTSADGHACH